MSFNSSQPVIGNPGGTQFPDISVNMNTTGRYPANRGSAHRISAAPNMKIAQYPKGISRPRGATSDVYQAVASGSHVIASGDIMKVTLAPNSANPF